eukprot:1453171-Amphidinium_carterae.1
MKDAPSSVTTEPAATHTGKLMCAHPYEVMLEPLKSKTRHKIVTTNTGSAAQLRCMSCGYGRSCASRALYLPAGQSIQTSKSCLRQCFTKAKSIRLASSRHPISDKSTRSGHSTVVRDDGEITSARLSKRSAICPHLAKRTCTDALTQQR